MRDPLILKWPRALAPRTPVRQINRPGVFGPEPIGGSPQSVSSEAGHWRLSYEGVPFNQNNRSNYFPVLDRIAAFREPVYVGPFDYAHGPIARASAVSPIESMCSDGTIFSDGWRWEASIYDCTLAANANEGSIEINVTNSVTAPLLPADFFELDGRLHRVVSINGSTWRIWPRLRASYSSGAKLEIADPMVKAYLTPESQALASRAIMGRYGDATLEFVEAPW